MLVYFARHGLARWPNWHGFDHERPLTPHGHAQLRALAQQVAAQVPPPDLILHSPYVRTTQTAEIWAEAFDRWDNQRAHPRLAPGFEARALRTLLAEYAQHATLLLVGHAPDMTEVVFDLTQRPVSFGEGTVAGVQLAVQPPHALLWAYSP